MKATNHFRAAAFGIALGFSGCSAFPLTAPSPGEYFRQQVAKIDDECKKRRSGPYRDSTINTGDTGCDFLFLKPWVEGDTPESAYAHSIKLPPPLDKPKNVYRQGMSPREYFDALCDAEAGEFIFRVVDGVSGVAELRPRAQESSTLNRHLTAYEDPATYESWQARAALFFLAPNKYHFFESEYAVEGRPTSVRYVGYDGENSSSMKIEKDSMRTARYGFTWRGIRDEQALSLGIAGGEVIVLDLQSGEVLAVNRKFALRYLGRFGKDQTISLTGIEQGIKCEGRTTRTRMRPTTGWEMRDFILDVLRPVPRSAR